MVSSVLFCYGDPGVRKTHIRYELKSLGKMGETKQECIYSSWVNDQLGRRPGEVSTFLYCDSHAHGQRPTAHLLGAILKQVDVPWEIEVEFERSKKRLGAGKLESGEILKLLTSCFLTMQRSYISNNMGYDR